MNWLVLGLLGLLGPAFFAGAPRAQASSPTPDTPSPRQVTQLVQVTTYDWLLIRWKTNQTLCTLAVEHTGVPEAAEIYTGCEEAVYAEWAATPPCPELGILNGDPAACQGDYLYYAGSHSAEREETIDLPGAVAWAALNGCVPSQPYHRCPVLPSLVLAGEDPLQDEVVVSIQGAEENTPFHCEGSACIFPLTETGVQGTHYEFWAVSSLGDESPHYSALVRVLPAPVDAGGAPGWYVDVLSQAWQGPPAASCAQTWDALPPVGGPADWLSTPDHAQDLTTQAPYYYLAGELIRSGAVSGQGCEGGGLQADGAANECGLAKAGPALVEWQNQFNSQILDVARETHAPARLIKRLFDRESQFWPGIYQTYREAGLGQLTENGADTLLLWDTAFYQQFCPLVLSAQTCERPFSLLGEWEQSTLKGALVRQVNAACPHCPAGIDLEQAEDSIRVFAASLMANCEQTGQLVSNLTGKPAGRSSGYVDLWSFTLVNYNAGSGCLGQAIQNTLDAGQSLDWANVSGRLEGTCRAAVDYVADIEGSPSPTSTLPGTASQGR